MGKEYIHLLKVFYPGKEEPETIFGIIDYQEKIIKMIDINEKHKKGFKETGIINLNYVKKIEIIEKAGCLSSPDEYCDL